MGDSSAAKKDTGEESLYVEPENAVPSDELILDVVSSFTRRKHFVDRMEIMPALGKLVASDASTTQHLQIAEQLNSTSLGLVDLETKSAGVKESLADLETRINKLRKGLHLDDEEPMPENTGEAFDISKVLPTAMKKKKTTEHFDVDAELRKLYESALPIKVCPRCTCEILDMYWAEHETSCFPVSPSRPRSAMSRPESGRYRAAGAVGSAARPRLRPTSASIQGGVARPSTREGDRATSPSMDVVHSYAPLPLELPRTNSSATIRTLSKGNKSVRTIEDDNSMEDIISVEADYSETSSFLQLNSPKLRPYSTSNDFTYCDLCYHKFHKRKINEHMRKCRPAQAAREYAARAATDVALASAPEAPTAVRCCGRSATHLQIAWDPPIFDGGAAVGEYQMMYCRRKYADPKRHIIGWIDESMPVAVIKAAEGQVLAKCTIVLENLHPDTDYSHFKVQAINKAGKSPWSAELASVRTDKAEKPSAPTKLRIIEVSSSACELAWDVAKITTDQIALEKFVLYYKRHKIGTPPEFITIDIPGDVTRFRLENLTPATRFSDMKLKAVDKSGAESEYTPPVKFETDRETQSDYLRGRLRDLTAQQRLYETSEERTPEMEEASIARLREMDDIRNTLERLEQQQAGLRLQSTPTLQEDGELPPERYRLVGTSRRISTVSRMRVQAPDSSTTNNELLAAAQTTSGSLPGIVEHPETEVHEVVGIVAERRRSSMARLAIGGVELTYKDELDEKLRIRRKHFDSRIVLLNMKLEAVVQDQHTAELQLTRLHKLMSDVDLRLQLLNAEQEIVRDYPGQKLESTVLHGQKALYVAAELRTLIETEGGELEKSMASLRALYLETAGQLDAVKKNIDGIRYQIVDRKAALAKFDKQIQKEDRLRDIMYSLTSDISKKCFSALRAYTAANKRARRTFLACLTRWMNVKKLRAWNTWKTAVRATTAEETKQVKAAQRNVLPGLGIGSMLLGEAEHLRMKLATDVNRAMKDLLTVKGDIAASEYTVEERVMLTLADGPKANAGLTFAGPTTDSDASLPQELFQEAFNPLNHPNVHVTQSSVHDNVTALTLPMAQQAKGASTRHKETLNPELVENLQSSLTLAVAYAERQEFAAAYRILRHCEVMFGTLKNADGLLAIYRTYSRMLEAVNRFDLAAVMWDRTKNLAMEVKSSLHIAEAHQGLGRIYLARQDPVTAIDELFKGLKLCEQRGDRRTAASICKQLSAAYRMMQKDHDADEYEKRGQRYSYSIDDMIRDGHSRLVGLRGRVLGAAVQEARRYQLEACGILLPQLRMKEKDIQNELKRLATGKDNFETQRAVIEKEAQACITAMQAASQLPPGEILQSSLLNNGIVQQYTASRFVEEATIHLAKLQQNLDELEDTHNRSFLRQKNLAVALQDVQQHIQSESSTLARVVYKEERMRLVALNGRNHRLNDVMGMAACGTPRILAATSSSIMAFSTINGECQRAIVGRHFGKPGERNVNTIGHTNLITSMAYYGTKVVTGAADGSVCVWHLPNPFDDMSQSSTSLDWEAAKGSDASDDPEAARREAARKAGLLHTLLAHGGSIVSLAINAHVIVSGASDNTTFVWNVATGALLRRLRAHELATTSISLHEQYFATGSVDKSVILWRIEKSADPKAPVRIMLDKRLEGHNAPVLCLHCNGADVASGDANGEVIIWNTTKGTLLRRYQLHEPGKGVLLLQFDATKLMTYGTDDRLVLSDLLRGTMMQDHYMPHGGARMLALQFGTDELITVGEDRSVRVWAWKNGRYGAKPREVGQRPSEHIVTEGQKLRDIAWLYGVTSEQLMDWNNLQFASELLVGTRLTLYPPLEAVAVSFRAREDHTTVKAVKRAKSSNVLKAAGLGDHNTPTSLDRREGFGKSSGEVKRRQLKEIAQSAKATCPVKVVDLISDPGKLVHRLHRPLFKIAEPAARRNKYDGTGDAATMALTGVPPRPLTPAGQPSLGRRRRSSVLVETIDSVRNLAARHRMQQLSAELHDDEDDET